MVPLPDGRILFAGGCGAHPNLAQSLDGFFSSVVAYDPLADAWADLAPMARRRHGCSGVLANGKVYVFGGDYVDDLPPCGCEVSDPSPSCAEQT